MADDVLGLRSLFGGASQGLTAGMQDITNALAQRKKQQQEQSQFNTQQATANRGIDVQAQGEADRAAEAEGAARQHAKEYNEGAAGRAAGVEQTKTTTANAKAKEGREAQDFSDKKAADDLAKHVAANLTGDSTPEDEVRIVQGAYAHLPDASPSEIRAEIKKQKQQIKDQGLSDAQKQSGINLQTSEAAKNYALAAAAGKKGAGAGGAAEADSQAGKKSAEELIDDAIANAGSGKVNFGLQGKAAENSPTGMQSLERQNLDSALAELKTEVPLLIAKAKRAPNKTELNLIATKLLPDTNSTISQEDFVSRLKDVKGRIHRIAADEAAAHGAPAPGLATKMLGPSPSVAGPQAGGGAAPVVGDIYATEAKRKRLMGMVK